MADETTEAVSGAAAEHGENDAAHRERFAAQFRYDVDPRLLLLAPAFSTDPDATIELTVVVDGTVISGPVVSGPAWTQRQNDQVRIGSPAIADILDSLNAEAAGPTPAAESGPEVPNRYLHFLAPALLSGGVRLTLPATRVDLRKVSAWSIGRIPGD